MNWLHIVNNLCNFSNEIGGQSCPPIHIRFQLSLQMFEQCKEVIVNKLKKVYQISHKISDVFSKILCALIVLLVITNVSAVLLQVINRYLIVKVFDFSFSWTDELARFSMIWITYLTLPLCFREGSMAQLDLLFDRFGEKGRKVLYLLTRVLITIFILIAVKYGWQVMKSRLIYRSAMLHAPGIILYSAPIIGSILTGYEVFVELIGVWSEELTPFEAGEKRGFAWHNEPIKYSQKQEEL